MPSLEDSCEQVWRISCTARKAGGLNSVERTHGDSGLTGQGVFRACGFTSLDHAGRLLISGITGPQPPTHTQHF